MILTETLPGLYIAEQKKKKKERKPIIFFIKTKIFRPYLLQCNVATTSVIICPSREENKELLKIFVNFLGQVVLQFLMNFMEVMGFLPHTWLRLVPSRGANDASRARVQLSSTRT